jgi:hypothetical protein
MRGLDPRISIRKSTIDPVDRDLRKKSLPCGVVSLDDPAEFARLDL